MKAPGLTRPTARVVAGGLYVYGMVAVAALAAWPIYRSGSFVLVVVASVVVATAIALVSRARAWPGWLMLGATAVAAVVLGVLLAVPARAGDVAQLPAALGDVLLGAVTGWKDLVTVDLPVGSYRNLLVPALIVFLFGTVFALRLAWLNGRAHAFAAIVTLAMVFFGLAFGRPVTSEPWIVAGFAIPAPVETLTGAVGLLLSLIWLAWRSQDDRSAALRRAADTSGVRVSRRRSASDARRAALAGSMVAVAVVAAAVAAPAVARGDTRDVLRSGVGPELVITRATSPLSGYRSYFDDASHDTVLFRVDPVQGGGLPDRIRLATLTAYDGEVYRALDASTSVVDARFTRVPARRSAGPGEAVTVRVTIEGLSGIWAPIAGRLQEISFQGRDAAALADSFYYNQASAGAVETARGGLATGDVYTVSAVVPDAPDLAGISAPGAPRSGIEAPASLLTWLESQNLGSGGTALAEAISRLRERGYLSHALSIPEDEPAAWMSDLGAYAFRPSAAGHSLARVDALFRQLLEHEAQAAAVPGNETSLVAAVGDDEQFAVAAALIAERLGFPARVVVGARLDAGATGLPACENGVCEGGDVAAWIEVQSSEGEWVTVDVTPQHAVPIDTETRQQRDPKNETEVRPETAEEIDAPPPVQQDTVSDETPDVPPVDLSGLWGVLRVVGIVALVLALALGPFVIVLVAKAVRRRARRGADDARSRVVGGWDEYVDAAVDHGLPAPQAETRTELASLYATTQGSALAVTADRAVFSRESLSVAESAEFWKIVDAERRGLGAEIPMWRRAAAAVSLKSFTRYLAPGTSRAHASTAQRSERRMRARPGDDPRAS